MKTLLNIDKEDALELDGRKYRLLEFVGHGGSSIVYKAREEGKRDYIVIKELNGLKCAHMFRELIVRSNSVSLIF